MEPLLALLAVAAVFGLAVVIVIALAVGPKVQVPPPAPRPPATGAAGLFRTADRRGAPAVPNYNRPKDIDVVLEPPRAVEGRNGE